MYVSCLENCNGCGQQTDNGLFVVGPSDAFQFGISCTLSPQNCMTFVWLYLVFSLCLMDWTAFTWFRIYDCSAKIINIINKTCARSSICACPVQICTFATQEHRSETEETLQKGLICKHSRDFDVPWINIGVFVCVELCTAMVLTTRGGCGLIHPLLTEYCCSTRTVNYANPFRE